MGIVNDICGVFKYLKLQKQLSVSEGRSVTSAPVYIEHVPIYLPIFQSYPWEGLDFGY